MTRQTALAALVGALAGGWLGGAPGALGVLTGGALALVSFRVVAARVRTLGAGPAPAAPWAMLAALRFVAVGGGALVLVVAGWAHPVAWLAGYSLLPVAVVSQGLRLAREESNSWT